MGTSGQHDGRINNPFNTARTLSLKTHGHEDELRRLAYATSQIVERSKSVRHPLKLSAKMEAGLRDLHKTLVRIIEHAGLVLQHAEYLVSYHGSGNHEEVARIRTLDWDGEQSPPVVLGPGGDFTKPWPHGAEKAIAGRHAERVAREPERDFQNVTAENDDEMRRRKAAVRRENLGRALGVRLEVEA